MKIKYQISSQASTVGNSVNLKFLIKQKKNFTRRALESDDDDDDDSDYDSMQAIDLSNVDVLNENETISFLAEDEDFEIVWWFYLMIAFLVVLIFLVVFINRKYSKILND